MHRVGKKGRESLFRVATRINYARRFFSIPPRPRLTSCGSTSRRAAMAQTVRPFQLKADHVFVAQAFQPLDGGEFKIGFGATVGA